MGFKIRIEPSNHMFEAEDRETILEAGLRHGVMLPYSCRNGACGTCKGKVVSGVIDYGDYDAAALTDDEKAAGMALFCRALPRQDLVIEAREISAVKDIPVRTLPCRVAMMDKPSQDVMVLALKIPAGERLQFLPGQYIDVLLKDGKSRSFSLANAPYNDEFLELHIRHILGGLFSGHVFTDMKERDLLRIRGPLGTFFLREASERPVVLMAGGTGFAPIKAMLEHAFDSEMRRPLHLFWGARAKQDLYMHRLVQGWAQEHGNFRYTPVLSEPLAGDGWQGRLGWVHEAVVEDYPDLSSYEVYASGPPPMIQAGKTVFLQHGLDMENYYYDSFEYAQDGE